MGHIKPANPELLDDEAPDYQQFSCCGDEDLVFLKCPSCGHIWVECFECSTWFTDLSNLDIRQSSYLGSDDQRVRCPACDIKFDDFHYLADENCDKYLTTREEVITAGWGEFLRDDLKPNTDAVPNKENPAHVDITEDQSGDGAGDEAHSIAAQPARPLQTRIRIPVGANRSLILAAGMGVSSWIVVLAILLANKDLYFGAGTCIISAAAVMVVGFLIASRATRGKLITLYQAALLLLSASFFFGLGAMLVLQTRSELEPILDEKSEFPVIWNFGAPLVVLVMMIGVSLPPIRKHLARHFV